MTPAGEDHPAVTAWRALSEQTLSEIDAAVLPGQSGRQDSLRRRFLVQRNDYHRARKMYERLEHRPEGDTIP